MNNISSNTDGPFLVQQERQHLMPSEPTFPWRGLPSSSFPNDQGGLGHPKALNGVLVLDEEDKQALLAVLDGPDPSGAPVLSQSDRCPTEQTHGNTFADKRTPSNYEEAQALKLKQRRAMATTRRNRHRRREKEERQMLKLQCTQLDAALEELRRSRANGTPRVDELNWELKASKALDARLRAEDQQCRVRREIERRAAVMQVLQEMLDTQQRSASSSLTWSTDDIKLYVNFASELPSAFAPTDTVLYECSLNQLAPPDTSFYKPVLRRDAARNTPYFESTSAFCFPSKYPSTTSAMFEAMRQVHRQNPHQTLLEREDTRSHTIAVKFGKVNHCEEERVVSFTMLSALRRFVESDRTVLVWRCLVEGEGAFAGTYLDETGWSVLRPATSDSTEVRTCIRSVPLHRSCQATGTATD